MIFDYEAHRVIVTVPVSLFRLAPTSFSYPQWLAADFWMARQLRLHMVNHGNCILNLRVVTGVVTIDVKCDYIGIFSATFSEVTV